MKKSFVTFLFCFLTAAAFSQIAAPMVAEKPNALIKVPATAAQITGTWTIAKIERDKKPEIAAGLIKDSFFTFGADQTYNTKIMGVVEEGKWEFGPENTAISMSVNNQKTIWNILKISDSELIMQKGTRGNKVTFSKNQ